MFNNKALKNPLTNKNFSNQYKSSNKWWLNLPVYKDADKIIKLIEDNQVLLIISGTGSGKSTLVPFFALDTLDYKGKVVMTIPKRGIVLSAAQTSAHIADVELGKEVGYQFRGSKLPDGSPSKSSETKLLISTDGSIVAQLINDPSLKAYDIVIIDEAHERSIQIDILLLLMKKALKLNPNLKLIIMSATINPEIFANYFKKDFKYAEANVSGESNYPVENIFLDKPLDNPEKSFIDAGIDRTVKLLKDSDKGGILFFVNSLSEARQACDKLDIEARRQNISGIYCIEVSGEIARDKETLEYVKNANKFRNHPNGPFTRKVIIATNAVESSLTVNGLKYVIDGGYAFVDSYDPLKMERRLLQQRISKAQAKQRSGRVGRTDPGICYRLYTEKEFEDFIDYPVVDIKKSDLTDEFLRFMKLPYVNNISQLLTLLSDLIEPPDNNFVKSSLYRLYALGAIDKMSGDGALTEIGEQISKFRRLDPIMAKIVIKSFDYRVEYDTVLLASLITKADGKMNTFIKDMKNRNPRKGDKDYDKKERLYKAEKAKYDKAIKTYASSYGDVMTLIKLYKMYREYSNEHSPEETKKWCDEKYLRCDRLKDIKRSVQDIMRELQEIVFRKPANTQEKIEELEYIYSNKEEILEDKPKGGYKSINRIFMKGGLDTTDEATIMKVLLEGLFMNLAKSVGDNKYRNCFPFELSTAEISRESLLRKIKSSPKYIIYLELFRSNMGQKYNLVSKISEASVKGLDTKQKMMVKPCFVEEKVEDYRKNYRKEGKKKNYKKKSYKKSYKKVRRT